MVYRRGLIIVLILGVVLIAVGFAMLYFAHFMRNLYVVIIALSASMFVFVVGFHIVFAAVLTVFRGK